MNALDKLRAAADGDDLGRALAAVVLSVLGLIGSLAAIAALIDYAPYVGIPVGLFGLWRVYVYATKDAK